MSSTPPQDISHIYCETLIPKMKAHVCYRGADKYLARPGRKQTTATEDLDFHISYL
jgi:hypothetical protein